MNVLPRVKRPPSVAAIAHGAMAYDRPTGELELELPISLFLDTLAPKIARAPPRDEYGALLYLQDKRVVETFQFLLDLNVDVVKREYFLESTAAHATGFGPGKLGAVELLARLTPPARHARTENPRIS